MTTVLGIISSSLRLIEELGAGETASSESIADGMIALNAMLDTWSIQNGGAYSETVEQFTMTGSDGVYTLGPSGDFNTTRPYKIRAMAIHTTPNDMDSVEMIGAEQYAAYQNKETTGRPLYCYVDNGAALLTLRFLPVPDSAYTLTIYAEKPLSAFTSANDVLALPPGYEEAIRYNLAVRLAAEYGKEPRQAVVFIAGEGKMAIDAQNRSNDKKKSVSDPALLGPGSGNILTGYY